MGNNLFGARIAEKIAAALGSRLLPVRLIKVVPGTVDTSNLSGAQPETNRTFTCRGFFDSYNSRRMGGTAIKDGARVVLILADTLPSGIKPEPDDRIILEGETVEVVGPVLRDPDAATYIAEVKA